MSPFEDFPRPSRRASLEDAQGILVTVSAADRAALEAVVSNGNSPQKHVWRCRIVLYTVDGLGTGGDHAAGLARASRWSGVWQERFMQAGVDSLLHDKTRPIAHSAAGSIGDRPVVTLTGSNPPGETTHWTAAAMAKAVGNQRQLGSAHLARRMGWSHVASASYALQRQGLRRQAAKYRRPLRRSAGPCRGAVGDEKSQIQALDRTQTGAAD